MQSYVKWAESGGARVAPVRFDASDSELEQLLPSLNGFLFTGGGADFTFPNNSLTPVAATAQKIYNTVLSAASNGETVPLWGTCMGFQLMTFLASGPDPTIVTCPPFNSEDINLALIPTSQWLGSRLQSSAAAANVDNILTTQPVTANFHHCGVTPAAFNANPHLMDTFGPPLTTNFDLNHNAFVSTIEGRSLPLYGSQWHPEKPIFEWTTAHNTNHSDLSVKANSWTARFLVDQARLNDRSFPDSTTEYKALIYNFNPVYTINSSSYNEFEQCYFF
jgi:gamma-glutamyl hydrolase